VGDIAEDLQRCGARGLSCGKVHGGTDGEIAEALKRSAANPPTLAENLLESGRLVHKGKGPAARYRLLGVVEEQKETAARQAGQKKKSRKR